MRARQAGAILSALAIAAGAAGCGGSSSSGKVSPSAYVSSVCRAVGPLESDIRSREGQLAATLGSIKSASRGKAVLQGFLQAFASDTDGVLSKLRSAGTPNVPNGRKISEAMVSVFQRLDTAVKSASRQAGSLPTSSSSAFRAAAARLGTSVQTSVSGIGSSLADLKSPQLEKAAANSPACKSINGG
jgi:hypothetical protein